MGKILRLSVTLHTEKITILEKEFECRETEKMYILEGNREKRQIRKSQILVPDSYMYISSHLISYHLYCLSEQKEEAIKKLLLLVDTQLINMETEISVMRKNFDNYDKATTERENTL